MTQDTTDAHQTGIGRGPLLDADSAREALLELAAVVRTLFGVELAPAPAASPPATYAPTAEPVDEPAAEPVVTSEVQESNHAPVVITLESWEASSSDVEQAVAADEAESHDVVASAAFPPDSEVVELPASPVLHAIPVPGITAPADSAVAAGDSALSVETASEPDSALPADDDAQFAHAISLATAITVTTEMPVAAEHANSLAPDHAESVGSGAVQAVFPMAIPLPQVDLVDAAAATVAFNDTPAPVADGFSPLMTETAHARVVDTSHAPVAADAAAHPAAVSEVPLLASPGTEPTPYVDPIEQGLPIPAADVPALATTPDRHSLALLQEIAFLDD